MEDHVLPPFFQVLAHLLPDHLKRNRRILKLLSAAHDDMLDAREAKLLLKVYRQFIVILLTDNPDPLLTERVKDAFVAAVVDMDATLSAGNAKGFEAENRTPTEAGSGVKANGKVAGRSKVG